MNNRDQYDETPLHRASWEGHLEVAALLMAQGAEVNSRAGTGKTPLHRAARQNNGAIIELLLAHGAALDPETLEQETPLHWAAFTGAARACELLLAAGADPSRENRHGENAAQVAKRRGHHAVAAMIEATPQGAHIRFLLVLDPIFQSHVCPNLFHPECPGRVVAIERQLAKAIPVEALSRLPVREATIEELTRVHTAAYIESLTQTLTAEPFGYLDPQTYWDKSTLSVAKSAVGTTIDLATAIASPNHPATRGVAVVRPPGHHARPSQAMGFCIFNTIACAAAALLHGSLTRVAVVDMDFHHGNGTQEIFYERDDLLFLSLHERDTFPGTGLPSERGAGAGEGFTLNAVLEPQAGDQDLLAVVDQLFAPALRQYKPQIILVSAGFDAHERDRLGNMNVTREGFSRLFTRLRALAHELCDGKILAVLEGGYNHDATATACADLILAWSKEGCVRYPHEQLSPTESTRALIEEQQHMLMIP